ncbi:hypothetical protein DAEQUDRAFT_754412 [Daedalea quercina L-15889]|uniref:Uncharacterized protein n=1 Tax=Daedalea quercina L-15889 TaxID=1314783 RepID=A0A165TKF8_9APHY|nr:hypothetical protein DAEQUDRAFT_754412 [Daedalea quercina L-15889]
MDPLTRLFCTFIKYLFSFWVRIILRCTTPEEDIESIIVPYPTIVRPIVLSMEQVPEVGNSVHTAGNHGDHLPPAHHYSQTNTVPDVSPENVAMSPRDAPLRLEQLGDAREHTSSPSFQMPPSPCPSLCVSVGSSAASTTSDSVPPTPIASPFLGEPEVRIGDLRDILPVRNEDHANEVSLPTSSTPDFPEVPAKLNLGLPSPPPLCPTPLVRRSSNLVPIRSPSAQLTAVPDPFGAFVESYFADEPKASVVSSNAVPDLYNFDVYASSSTPPRRQRTREFEYMATRKVNPTGVAGEQGPVTGQTLENVVCRVPAKDLLKGPPKLRTLLLPQELERRASREISPASAPARGIRPLMLPLHVANRRSAAAGRLSLPLLPPARRFEGARLSLPSAKPPVSYPPPRVRPLSDIPDLERGFSAPGDAIEIAEKGVRLSKNLVDIISLLDGIGVTGVPQREDPRPRATIAAGTISGVHPAEAVRNAFEVPVYEGLDRSQDKQEGIYAGGVSAAFDREDDEHGYSRKLDDIVSLLNLPECWNTAPEVYSLEHADEIRSRDQMHKWGYAV